MKYIRNRLFTLIWFLIFLVKISRRCTLILKMLTIIFLADLTIVFFNSMISLLSNFSLMTIMRVKKINTLLIYWQYIKNRLNIFLSLIVLRSFNLEISRRTLTKSSKTKSNLKCLLIWFFKFSVISKLL